MSVIAYVSQERDPRTDAVLDAVMQYDLTSSTAWNALDALATHVDVDDVEVDPEGILFDGDGDFHGSASLYLLLRYGSEGDEIIETAESFRGQFRGRIVDGVAQIDDMTVDTRAFFEGEEID